MEGPEQDVFRHQYLMKRIKRKLHNISNNNNKITNANSVKITQHNTFPADSKEFSKLITTAALEEFIGRNISTQYKKRLLLLFPFVSRALGFILSVNTGNLNLRKPMITFENLSGDFKSLSEFYLKDDEQFLKIIEYNKLIASFIVTLITAFFLKKNKIVLKELHDFIVTVKRKLSNVSYLHVRLFRALYVKNINTIFSSTFIENHLKYAYVWRASEHGTWRETLDKYRYSSGLASGLGYYDESKFKGLYFVEPNFNHFYSWNINGLYKTYVTDLLT